MNKNLIKYTVGLPILVFCSILWLFGFLLFGGLVLFAEFARFLFIGKFDLDLWFDTVKMFEFIWEPLE